MGKSVSKIKKACAVFTISAFLLSGCASPFQAGENGVRVVFTTGFSKDEVFRIEDTTCSLAELKVYLINMQNEYGSTLGSEIWNAEVDGESLTERVKSSCLARIAQIKTMVLLANQNGIALDDSQEQTAEEAAKSYYDSLTDAEIKAMDNVDLSTIRKMYEEKALAEKVYKYIIRDINPEVSDDEARTLTVQQILMKTYTTDDSGTKTEMTEEEKAAVYAKMQKVLEQIKEGTDFESLVETYNEADESSISFGKGEVDSALEETAFNLSTDEVSGIVETAEGYMIVKCVTTFNKEETEANKARIVEERKSEAFGEEYDDFTKSLTRELNKNLWKKITLSDDDSITTKSFFDVYNSYFGES